MNVTVPILVEQRRPANGNPVFIVRPLFFAGPAVRGEKLERVLDKLSRDLANLLGEQGKARRQEDIARYSFYPRLTHQRVEVPLETRRQTARCRFLFVSFKQFERRIVFTPALPDLWFDLERNESLRDRAAEVINRYCREQERDNDGFHIQNLALTGTAYVTPLEVNFPLAAMPPVPKDNKFLALGDDGPANGGEELRRVGRNLDRLYPDELDRAVYRDDLVAELTRLLDEGQRRPVLVVGPRLVGKTTLIHEYVYRQVEEHRSHVRNKRNVWLLAPSRLISGMSYVGQWENRVLAILKEARKRDHLLYFDDLLGLFQAGQTSQSALTVAHLLKPYLEQRKVRVLGEITPEALRILRELDRGFADLFHILSVPEPTEAETLRTLIAVQRQLEDRERCTFQLDALPVVLDLQRRYNREAAFPGKAAAFQRQLAVKHRKAAIGRQNVLHEFQLRSGLVLTFLDPNRRLRREEILTALGKGVIGQAPALEAAADVIAIAKARLNDPHRPLASFLFLGPTGVGKTQCAKALAEYLYGQADRLVRFDLNEFAESGAAVRLVGTFGQPEGLLTAAIRRQPFAVVLFDEIEKAHPEVFDLLLQVLGEGRLTDALGRTADFANALIILTSNLGVRESESAFGLRRDDAAFEQAFVTAAERFFRPEFFNRIDRIIPFRRLTREQVRGIARLTIDAVFQREGVVQRQCLPYVEPAALERIVDEGFDPILGARALKRAVERQLAQPLAAQLASQPPGGFTAVRVFAGPSELTVQTQPLLQVERQERPALDVITPKTLLKRVRTSLRAIDEQLAPLRPSGALSLKDVSLTQRRYYAIREQLEAVRDLARQLDDQLHDDWPTTRRMTHSKPDNIRLPNVRKIYTTGLTPRIQDQASILNINEYLREIGSSAQPVAGGAFAGELWRLADGLALLSAVADSLTSAGPERVLLWYRPLDPNHQGSAHWLAKYCTPAFTELRLSVESSSQHPDDAAALEYRVLIGPHAWALAQLEAGVHLFSLGHEPVFAIQVEVLPLAEGATPEATIATAQERQRTWATALAAGTANLADDPFRIGRIVRIYGDDQQLDLRTQLTFDDHTPPSACLLAALPLPADLFAPAEE
jgi:ATP-dependent Clp protease ATP-binding subunit ClpA